MGKEVLVSPKICKMVIGTHYNNLTLVHIRNYTTDEDERTLEIPDKIKFWQFITDSVICLVGKKAYVINLAKPGYQLEELFALSTLLENSKIKDFNIDFDAKIAYIIG
jgi:hypothetical protein